MRGAREYTFVYNKQVSDMITDTRENWWFYKTIRHPDTRHEHETTTNTKQRHVYILICQTITSPHSPQNNTVRQFVKLYEKVAFLDLHSSSWDLQNVRFTVVKLSYLLGDKHKDHHEPKQQCVDTHLLESSPSTSIPLEGLACLPTLYSETCLWWSPWQHS